MSNDNDIIPRGPKNRTCPMWHKPMFQVCHTCPLWMRVTGKDPQGTATIDRWNCALAWQTVLGLENGQINLQAAHAMVQARDDICDAVESVTLRAIPRLDTGGVQPTGKG
jgi:hypothetical protein